MTGCGGAVVLFIIGGFATLIPVVGVILGPAIIILGFILPFAGAWEGVKGETKTMLFIEGPCPYCKGDISVLFERADNVFAKTCPICRKRFVVREKQFWNI